jgi:hypothetical protein
MRGASELGGFKTETNFKTFDIKRLLQNRLTWEHRCVCVHTHARTHARTHTRTHAHTHTHSDTSSNEYNSFRDHIR